MDKKRINPDVVNIPLSKREAILAATKNKNNLANLASGNPCTPMPHTIIERLQGYLESGYSRYTDYYGFPELRQGLARMLHEKWNIRVDWQKELMVSCGVQQGLYLVMRTLLRPGDEVLVPSPHYGTFVQNAYACGALPVLIPLEETKGFIPDPVQLEQAVNDKTRIIIFCNPNNPLGVVWPQDCLEALAQLACKHDLLVLVDEIYRNYTFSGKPLSISTLPGMRERTFTFGGFSKSHRMMGMRIGFVTGPAELMAMVKKLHYCVSLCPSEASQVAALAALDCPDEELRPVVEEYRSKLEMLYRGIAGLPGVSCVSPEGGFYLFPNFSRYASSSMDLALRMIEEAGVITLPGTEFGERGEGFLRLSVCVPREEVSKGLRRIEDFVLNENEMKKG